MDCTERALRSLTLTSCVVDLETGAVLGGGKGALTNRELALLKRLAEAAPEVVSRDTLLEEVFGYHPNTVSRAVDKAMNGLRGKVERDPAAPEHLITVFGAGYRFVPLEMRAAESQGPVALPPELDAFVGREGETAQLAMLLEQSGLVTILGMGGVGKTRLARRAARQWAQRTGRAAYFVDLSRASSAEELAVTVASELGDASKPVARLLAERGDCLVVLDNLEQLVEHAGLLAGWRGQARLLVTSRVRLELPGERVVVLEPLSLRDGVELLCRRSSERGHALPPLDALSPLVARLDGLPLALELAAARLGSLGPAQILARLESLLSPHGPLRDMLDWSWDLLDGPCKTALAELSVFAGGFSVEQAEEILRPSSDGRPVLELLDALLDASLLVRRLEGASVRLDLLVLVRTYAEQKLRELGADVVERAEIAHGQTFTRLALQLLTQMRKPGSTQARRQCERHHDNLLAACRRARTRQDVRVAVETGLCVGIARQDLHFAPVLLGELLALPLSLRDRARLVAHQGYALSPFDSEAAHQTLARAVQLAEELAEPELLADAHRMLGSVLVKLGRFAEARQALQRALEIGAEDPFVKGPAYRLLSLVERDSGNYESALSLGSEAVDWYRRADWTHGVGVALSGLGGLHLQYCFYEESERSFQSALEVFEQLEDHEGIQLCRGNLAIVAMQRGDFETARERLVVQVAYRRQQGHRDALAALTGYLAMTLERLGRLDEAWEYGREAEALALETGEPMRLGESRQVLGYIRLLQGKPDEALTWLWKAEEALRPLGHPPQRGAVLCAIVEAHCTAGRKAQAQEALALLSAWPVPHTVEIAQEVERLAGLVERVDS